MKKNLTLIAVMLMMVSVPAFSQFTFTAAPGLNLNSASFGYKMGKVVPYIGLQYCGLSGSYTLDVDYESATDVSNEMKITGKVIMPTIGVKYFAIEKNKVKGYLNASVSKPFLAAKLTFDGEESEGLAEEVDKVSLLGGTFGVGAEYFFDDNFSIGGEFGLNLMFAKYTDTEEDTDYNGNGPATIERTLKGMAMPTYSKISLNFYF